MTLREAHEWWSWVVVVSNAVAGAWALGGHRYAALRRPALWWCTLVAQLAVFVQVIIGVVLVNAQDHPLPRFHAFYGFVAIATIGIIYSYRSQLRHRIYLLYGFGGLFVMGLAIRAMLLRT
jgi:uncharacterized membrane protein